MKLYKFILVCLFTTILATNSIAGAYEWPVVSEEKAAELKKQDEYEAILLAQMQADNEIKLNIEKANKKSPLSSKEKDAVKLSSNWLARGAEPYIEGSGKLMYIHGISFPTILASPMQVVDIELQAGEVVNEIVVGDSSRWLINQGSVANIAHIFIKPIDFNLDTNAVITTNRRVYHLRLLSQEDMFTPYIGFTYPTEMKAYEREKSIAEKRQEQFNTISTVSNSSSSTSSSSNSYNNANIHERRVDIADLNFDYKLYGSYSWKPERVYDDGVQTFIRFPKVSEMPILLVKNGRNNVLVNYRVVDNTMIIDGVFDTYSLVLGVGGEQEEIILNAK